tara:strand:+ start:703 stop:1137 length:435 start_codon:yes stop_codon:yes gene_type:complete
MRKVVFDEGEAKRLRGAGMSYENIANHIEGATKVTIWRFLNPGKLQEHRESTKRRQRLTKARLVESKGGKCCIPGCDYDTCHTSLNFHHLVEEDKSFGIGDRKCAPIEELLKEAEKTILVCTNCHGEIHEGLHDEFINNLLKTV